MDDVHQTQKTSEESFTANTLYTVDNIMQIELTPSSEEQVQNKQDLVSMRNLLTEQQDAYTILYQRNVLLSNQLTEANEIIDRAMRSLTRTRSEGAPWPSLTPGRWPVIVNNQN
jgi:hypothetical protein